jgi:hypothetical protein
VAMELITQENVNTINSFRCMNFHARNKKMHIEIKIQQRTALSFCVNLSTGIAGCNGCDITHLRCEAFSMVEIDCYFGILCFHGNIGLLHNADNSPFDSTLLNYNAKRFGANELVDMHRSRTTVVNFFVFNTSGLVKLDRDLQRMFYKMCRYFGS